MYIRWVFKDNVCRLLHSVGMCHCNLYWCSGAELGRINCPWFTTKLTRGGPCPARVLWVLLHLGQLQKTHRPTCLNLNKPVKYLWTPSQYMTWDKKNDHLSILILVTRCMSLAWYVFCTFDYFWMFLYCFILILGNYLSLFENKNWTNLYISTL